MTFVRCERCHEPLTSGATEVGCLNCLLLDALAQSGVATPTSTQVDSLPDPPADHHYQHYEILTREDGSLWELGRGAMGVTYKALDVNLRVPVALKVINARYSQQADARRLFLREARSAARLRHPNVASVFHFGTITRMTPVADAVPQGVWKQEECFYAMEFVEGETLEERLRRTGPFGATLTLEVAIQVTRALAEAERRGLVHRDLKPANIMLVAEAETSNQHHGGTGAAWVKVIDFGLAKAVGTAAASFENGPLDAESSLSRTGFLGTPHFASPEQFDGGKNVDARSDLFSLGVVLWYLLTRELPFKGGSLGEIHAQQLRPLLPVEQLRKVGTPPPLIYLLTSMLKGDPACRPASALTLHRALEDCLGEVQSHPLRPRGGRFTLADRKSKLIFATVTAAASLGAASTLYTRVHSRFSVHTSPAAHALAPEIGDKSVAVLPFENRSSDKDNAFFSEGIQEEIIADLAKVAALRVTPRTSVVGYGSAAVSDPKEIGKQLGVAHLLEGSVQRANNRVQVSVQLIDARTNTTLWADRYERDLADVFAIQSEIAQAVAAKLRATLAPGEQAAIQEAPTRDLAAYDAYRLGRKRLAVAELLYDDRAMFDAVSLLEEATTRDPQFFQAWCELCRAYLSLCYLNLDNTPERLAQAEHAAQIVHRLRPDAGETHIVEALRLSRGYLNYAAAIPELQAAARLLPNSPDPPFWLGLLYGDTGRSKEAADEMEKAAKIDPRNAELWMRTSTLRHRAKQYPEAELALDRALVLDPTNLKFTLSKATWAWLDRADLEPIRSWLKTVPTESERWRDQSALTAVWVALDSRDFQAAARAMTRYRPQNVTAGGGYVEPREVMEGWIAKLTGDQDRGQTLLLTARRLQATVVGQHPRDTIALIVLAKIDAFLGQKDDAIREGRQAVAAVPETDGSYAKDNLLARLADIYAVCGERNQAIDTLQTLNYGSDAMYSYGVLRLAVYYDGLRGDPRFEALCQGLAPK